MSKIKENFVKLRTGHAFWVKENMAYRLRLEKAFDPLFVELEALGVARHFSEALLFFGKDFVDSFNEDKSPAGDNRSLDQAGLPGTVADAEKIFNVKARELDDKEIRESKLSKKSEALVYRSEPMKGDRVGIKVLSKIDD